ncbi:MAG: alpha/beta fold hydrolase [Propionibacteriales bacterium]|nr:alpha/beta fold hydrolase [Propionibacteriales bacterium]
MTHRRVLLIPALAGMLALTACGGASDIARDVTTSSPSPVEDSTPAGPTTSTETTDAGGLPDGFGAGPQGSGLDRFYDQQVNWTDCGGGDECADVWVPLDYSDPDGQAITVKAKRQPATDDSNRRGSLLINPGGPGGSGIDYLDSIDLDLSITDAYDVIGFDPRGVASSTPVDCVSDEQLDAYVASDPTPDTAAEIQDFTKQWTTITDGCVERSGPLLEHVSTVEVARDMDVIRSVVGDDVLSYFGASYGTYIGATYAALFPDKVGRMVLDGAVDPLALPRTTEVNQAAGFDVALTAYLEDCVDQGDCPLGDSVDLARQRLVDLFKQIDQVPLPTSSDRELTEGLAFYGVIVPLYRRDTWSYLTQALQQAVDGNGATLLLLADAYTQRQPDGSYPNNSLEVQSAVTCLDRPEDESLKEIKDGASDFTTKAPVFGQAAMWWPYACSNWPVASTEDQPDFSAKGAVPIVVVGTTRDPATPYQQSVNLAEELDSGVLLSRDGDGHTAYGAGNSCIDDAINTYLVEGTPPSDGKRC